jgi:hypothetical protein
MYTAEALGTFRGAVRKIAKRNTGMKESKSRSLKQCMLNLPRLIRIIHLLHCGIVQRTNNIYDTSTMGFPALLTS